MGTFILGGAGEVGYNLARALVDEGHEVRIVDADSARVERVSQLDVQAFEGNFCDRRFLEEELGIEGTETFIAVTGNDEVNMMSCVFAKEKGCVTVARTHGSHTTRGMSVSESYRDVGVDYLVCPEIVAANRVTNVLRQSETARTQGFLHNRVRVVEGRVSSSSKIIGKTIGDIAGPAHFTLFAIFRGDQVVLPKKETRLMENDRLLMAISQPDVLEEIQEILGSAKVREDAQEVRRVMIDGASDTGIQVARRLEKSRVNEARCEVVLLERDPVLAEKANRELKRTLVLQLDGTSREDLLSENVDTFDAFVGSTNDEAHNVLACLLARDLQVPRTVALVHQPELRVFLERDLLDAVIAPRISTVSAILRILHGAEDYQLQNMGHSQMAVFQLSAKSRSVGERIRDLGLPHECIIVAVARQEDVFLPRGEFVLEEGDQLLTFSMHETIVDLEQAIGAKAS